MSAEMLSNCSRTVRRILASLALCCLFIPVGTASAQDKATTTTEKWRPKDGIYGEPKRDSEEQCPEASTLTVELSEKSVSGYEWGCEINKLTDTAPGAIKLDMICNDYNLAESLYPRDPKAEEKQFKEVMLLKRIDDSKISVRKTLNGKFKDSAWPMEYCPADVQRAHAEAVARSGYQIPDQLTNPQIWRPRDGVYAAPGTDFNDRCTKFGTVVVALSQGSISTGKEECKATSVMITGVATFSMDMSCKQTSASQTIKKDRTTTSEKPLEVFRLNKIDDNTFFLQTAQNGRDKDAGGPVAYCPEEAQRIHAAQQAKK